MDRDIPAFNPIIIGQLQQKNLQMHQQRLNNIRSSQNSRSYLSSSANVRQNQNRKALQVQQQKKTEIERHNLMLFNRMKRIMSRNNPSNKPILPLNKHNRMSAELSRIEEQNRTMYQRIEQQKPTINNRKLEEDRKKNLNILKFLGKYSPHQFQNNNAASLRNSQGSSRGTLGYISQQQRNKVYSTKQDHYLAERPELNMHMKSQTREDEEFEDDLANGQDFKINLQKMIESKRNGGKSQMHHRYQSTEERQQTSTATGFKKSGKQSLNTIPKIAKDIILYKTNKQINGQSYEIKIIRKHATYQINCKPTDDRLKPLLIEYNQIEGNQLLEEYTYDYRAIIERLTVNEGVICLDGNYGVHANEEQQCINTEIKLQTSEENSYKKKGYYKSAVKMYENSSHITEQNEQESYRYLNEDHKYRPQRHDSVNEEEEGDSLGEPEAIDNQQQRQQTDQNQPLQMNDLQQNAKICETEQREKQIQITFKPLQANHQEGKYEEALDEEIL